MRADVDRLLENRKKEPTAFQENELTVILFCVCMLVLAQLCSMQMAVFLVKVGITHFIH